MEIRPIVEYPGYFAREDGEILNSDNKVLGKTLTAGGYHTVFIDGKIVHVHELILTTFDPLTERKNLVANHFDLDKLNNHVSNLDWVDGVQNNIHRVLMTRENPNRPHIKTVGEGKLLFNTIDDCAEHFNKSLREIWLILKEGLEIAEGTTLVYLKWDDIDVLRVVREETLQREGTGTRGVKLLDLFTNTITSYPSMKAAAEALGVGLTHIRNRISTEKTPKILHKRYIVSDEDGDFVYVTEELRKLLLGRGGKFVVACHIQSDTYTVHKSAYAFMKECGLNNCRKAITVNLKAGKIKEASGYYYSYLPDEHKDNPELYLKTKVTEVLQKG